MVSRTNAANPSAPLRKSTGLVATITRTAPVGPITRRLSTHAAPLSRSLRRHRGQPEPSHPRSRPRSFLHRAQPGAAAFCVDGGPAERTMPRPERPEQTEALQYAQAQSGKLAVPAASQIIAAVQVRAVYGRHRSAARHDLSDDPRLVFGAPRAPATCAGEHLKSTNQLNDSIIHCDHSKPNGYRNHQTRRSGHHQEGDLETPLTAGKRPEHKSAADTLADCC